MKLHFATVVFLIALTLNGICWGLLYGFVRRLSPPWRRGLRIALACFIGFELLGFCWITIPRMMFHEAPPLPGRFLPSLILLWNLLTLPLVTAFLLVAAAIRHLVRWSGKLYRRYRTAPVPSPSPDTTTSATEEEVANPNRRQFLFRTGAALLPAVSTLGMTVAAYLQLPFFRTRKTEVLIPDLPPELDGLRIAHVSDFHAGRFIDTDYLRRITDTVNALDVDLIAFTGDLIDYNLTDLPAALDCLRGMRSRYGLWLCEGNHDLYEDADAFRAAARASGLNFLFNDSRVITVREVPVQIIGLSWETSVGPDRIDWRADTFPILLGHHPHCFDGAVAAGIPLTLSGHTHGGQIMLTKSIGCGPVFFRYWSGLYEKEECRLVVSNGAGNWFPLRINAPAEIGLVTLKRV
ncbi:Predicted phosphohydrolase, MPP superfamily [Verrucomicrobium sp. GAS474]|uniref:metallophosphoesterase n=1 Tax=Verrucomicrobium sp. GAS474 TaxID=1882831 RepID=UPI00087AD9F0|nr:metallophosphoesterase [Verrucomicrobium sp. GAS474]SDU22786.1 Predicted phosphohydrolase, MPP superfamily [Verrucomicrobium sp. GAS474]